MFWRVYDKQLSPWSALEREMTASPRLSRCAAGAHRDADAEAAAAAAAMEESDDEDVRDPGTVEELLR